MTTIDTETLMAFADGELNEERAAEVKAALAANPALRAQLQALRNTDDLLRAAVTPSLDVPDRFAQLLQPQGASNVVPLARTPRAVWWMPAGAAVAAAFAVWVASSSLLTTQSAGWLRHVEDGVAISGALEAAAMNTRSGDLVRADNLNIRPVVSFVANDGRSCRELHVRDKEMAARIIACRDLHEDEWCIEALASIPTQEFPDTYKPAGAPRNEVIDAAFARIGVKSTMGAEEENAAIARKWTAAK
jgi:hypothetical protein